MLIAFAGRKSSGKTTLCNELLKRGFVKVSFADTMKKLVAQIYNWELEDLYTQKGKEETLDSPVQWNSETAKKLSSLTNLSIKFCGDRLFKKRREALQYIGTDVLRKADPLFHVNGFKADISKKEGDFVVDDLRFANELDVISELNGKSIFVMRPYLFEYSNHASEVSLTRKHCDYIIENDGSEKELIDKFNEIFKKIVPKKDDGFYNVTSSSAYFAGVMAVGKSISCERNYLTFSHSSFNMVDAIRKFIGSTETVYQLSNGMYCLDIRSNNVAEDLKLWDIQPMSARPKKVPDCLLGKPELINYWLQGVLDSLELKEN